MRRVRSQPPTGPRGPLFCLPTTDLKQSESIIFFNSYSLIVSCSKFESQNLF